MSQNKPQNTQGLLGGNVERTILIERRLGTGMRSLEVRQALRA